MSAAHAGPAALATVLLALGVGMTMIGRSWPDRRKHRGPRAPRRIEVEVPGHVLIPALAYGAVVPQSVAYCRGCRAEVPVTVHGDTYRCDRQHLNIPTTTGSAL
jgi:hypothetical protein